MNLIREVLPEAVAQLEQRGKAERILRRHAAGIPVSEEDVDWAARFALGLTQPMPDPHIPRARVCDCSHDGECHGGDDCALFVDDDESDLELGERASIGFVMALALVCFLALVSWGLPIVAQWWRAVS